MDVEPEDEVERVVANVQASAKYRDLCVDTIRRIAADEWDKRRSLKAAIQSTRSRLHQVYGAYERGIDYDRALGALDKAYAAGSCEEIRSACARLLSLHASTGERIPILDLFYARIFDHTGTPGSILDLACGLNPLALPWMGLDGGATYHAYDIDRARVRFLDRYLALANVQGAAHLQDVICVPPDERADVALLLKSATCLERQRAGSTLALLDQLRAGWVVVTFPVESLGRRKKGMPEHYARTFGEMLSNRPWTWTRIDFSAELAFLVDKR